jgi:hypothetical protein
VMNWREQYKKALVEIEPTRLLDLVHEAELAISARLESLPVASDEEIQQMSDATRTLRILKSYAATAGV